MFELILTALAIPFVCGLAVLAIRRPAAAAWFNLCGSLMTSATLFWIIRQFVAQGPFRQGGFMLDALNVLFLLIVAVLGLTAALYSIPYMAHELRDGHLTEKMISRYFFLFQFFVLTMILTLVMENLGLLWVAVEATTLVSALLVAFSLNRSSLEAAWKYVMVCSVGIAMALLGTILLYYAQVQAGYTDVQPLGWFALSENAFLFNPALVKLSAMFILIGYGTKAGLAPMHTWLPDAHSQAPTPVSGLLSGALLSVAMYAIARNLAVFNLLPMVGQVAGQLLVGFGLLSIGIAVPFLLLQHDIKRLLAYSSVENIGLVAMGFGLGSPLGLYGALLHLINNAIGKSALFYVSGELVQQYRTKQILRIRGVIRVMPVFGGMLLALVLAVSGLPPFGTFLSKLTIIQAMFHDSWWQGLLALLLLAAVFAGMIYYTLKMLFGEPPANLNPLRLSPAVTVAVGLSLLLLVSTGFYVPIWLDALLRAAVVIVGGGGR
jgi:hydrogenase-4 component F